MLKDQPDRNDGWKMENKEVSGNDRIQVTVRPGGGMVAQIVQDKE